ncbi:hypothetical protein [Paenibacillus sp. Aloe-11]|uniref:hypothetical protein n=1 Tax=Paenibacillus sp. Aloe-11 TaxID=1050222 RepID=UPI00024F0774|nr:hypothetical protein [Paenibacillus sp. Aloe-11]EHS58245.1 hypothetical protein WG8_1505 [Paenibacillus sp. Aloe-11]
MSEIIKDTKDFEEAQHLVSNVVYVEERLPNQVFKVPFQNKVVLDFDHAMSYGFWNEVEQLTGIFDDSFVIMAVLDPHPVNYYYTEFSQYNWCMLNKGTTSDEYWNTLQQSPIESPADSILSNSEVIVWLPSSMKWALWGERSYGICVLGFSDDIGDYKSESWFTMDKAITDLVSLNFRNYTVPDEIISKLMKYYSSIK